MCNRVEIEKAKMGNDHAKPSDRLKYIEREVNSLRSSIRSARRVPTETKEGYIQNLVKLSSDASALKGKVKDKNLQQTQRTISNTMNEVLTKTPRESELDMGAIETSSFIQMPVSKRQAPNKNTSERPAKKQKAQMDFSAKKGPSTLQEIEDKFKTLEPQIDVAIENKDTTQLRVHQETIKVLVTDLEMIEVPEDTPIGDRKKKLDANITAQYQRIGKTMKEIKRNRNINYLVKQNKKEKVIKELEEVQKNLNEAESLLSYSLKNNDLSAMKNIQENLTAIKQKLASLETPEETTKAMKMQLSDKITWFYQWFNDISKTGSQTDLSKAQSNYEDIVRNIASGKNKDREEIKAKLQSLRTFINNIADEDENSLKRKQQLLTNVKQSFSLILEDENNPKSESDGGPRKCVSGYKEVDSFYDTWKAIQKRIKSTTFPNNEVSKIDKILEDIQNSIAQTRLHINGDRTLQSDSTKKLNVSTPNLSHSKPVASKFGSSLSVDSGGQPIKTRAKVYDLSTPEIQNINNQPVVLRNKPFYKMSSELTDDKRFSKVEEIKTQVNYIKEKFPESQQKQQLKNKLESYVKILEGYIYHKNQAIANNAKLVLADINEMLQGVSHIQEVMNTTSQRRLSIEESFENIVAIQEAVDKIQKSVSSSSGRKDSYEYRKFKEELSYCRRCLEEMKVPPQYDMIQQQKEEILKKINHLISTLEHKYEHSGTVKTKQKLNELKEKVTRFSGGYKGVLYNKIEKDLNKLLVDVSDSVNDKDAADEIVKEAEKHLKILENRATRDQSFRRDVNDRHRNERSNEEALAKLKTDLLDIKRAIATTPTNGVNLFMGLRSRLDLVKLGLDQLKILTEEEEKQRGVLYSEEEALMNVVEAKISLARQSIRQWPLEQDRYKRDGEELIKIEEKFKSLKPEIENFVGTTSDNKFYELDETSIRLVLRMDKLQFSKGTENHDRKIRLLKEIYNYGDLLDQRAKETEDIVEIEREIYDVEKNFERYVRLNDFENLSDKISTIRKKLSSIETNKNLLPRKQNCVKRVDSLSKKVTTYEAKNREETAFSRDSKDLVSDMSKIEQYFSSLKTEINGFVGIHADRKYYELEGSLTALFPKLDNFKLLEESELQPRKSKLIKEIHIYCDILDKKAKENEMAREISKQLNAINSRVNDYKNTKEELKVMDTELRSVQKKLEKFKIDDEQISPLKEKFAKLFDQYIKLSKAKDTAKDNYIGSSSFLADVQNINKNKAPTNTRDKIQIQIDDIQREIDEITPKVSAFVDSDASDEYKKIEKVLLMLHLKISKLALPNDNEYYKRQLELEKNVQDCLNILDERAQDVDNLEDIEKDLETIAIRLAECISVEECNALDEKLIALQIKLGKLQVNDHLSQRKNECENKIILHLKLLKEKSSKDLKPKVDA